MIYEIPIQQYTVSLGNKIPINQHATFRKDAWIFCVGMASWEPHTKVQLTIHFVSAGSKLPPNTTVGSGQIDTEVGGRPSHDWKELGYIMVTATNRRLISSSSRARPVGVILTSSPRGLCWGRADRSNKNHMEDATYEPHQKRCFPMVAAEYRVGSWPRKGSRTKIL
jgi:hypothetical protein